MKAIFNSAFLPQANNSVNKIRRNQYLFININFFSGTHSVGPPYHPTPKEPEFNQSRLTH
jgi:hypothetical protein